MLEDISKKYYYADGYGISIIEKDIYIHSIVDNGYISINSFKSIEWLNGNCVSITRINQYK